ncbi:MAG: DUF4065 domain-containing protein [Oscillospiraceae bacterium]|nr:DUF4065 domain-containing protein [Oscillospiraceae bacterium]
MASVYDVAKYFVNINSDTDGDVSNMNLQKLLYYAQGRHLAKTGHSLFNENIEPWQHGPVVREIYHKYKANESNPIPPEEDFNYDAFTIEELTTLVNVEKDYGKYSALTLRNKSHAENSPWAVANEKNSNIIPTESIKEYFSENEKETSLSEQLELNGVKPISGIRNKDGVLILPKEEYDPEDD